MNISCLDIAMFLNAFAHAGLMHSAFFFNSTLSDSDIRVLASVTPALHTQPSCRCPPSHPVTLAYECSNPSGTSRVPRVGDDAHDVSFINDGESSTWWQSVTGEAPVNVTINLGGLRTALSIAFQFRSLLPRAMVLHYSVDGIIFSPRQYYAADCSVFGLPNNGLLLTPTDVNCITSSSLPLPDQFVEFRVLDVGNRPSADSIQSFNLNTDLQEFAQATHIRVELLDWNSEDPNEQYFAISEVIIYGQGCVCNGHADSCMDADCACEHQTSGSNCEICLPLFNNRPWVAGTVTSANECQMCTCNNHASSCVYDPDVATGVCIDCADNTQGVQCDSCIDFYYRPSGVPIDSPTACRQCNCTSAGVSDDRDCQRGDSADGSDSGQCGCKELVTGRTCDQCAVEHFNLTASNPQGCEVCQCNEVGTIGGSTVCDFETGQCPCKPNVIGLECFSCAPGHFGIERDEGCLPCDGQCNECVGPGPTDCVVSN